MPRDPTLIRIRRAAACALLVAALPVVGQPQTAYVGDRIEIGLHADKAVASTILALLPSGTVLEILERDGDFVRVQTAQGDKGWVDARFLSDTEPGRLRVQSLETELAGAQAALADTQARVVALEQELAQGTGAGTAAQEIPSEALREMQALAEENQNLKQQVAELEAVQRMTLEQQRDPPPAPAAAAPAPAPAPATEEVAPPALAPILSLVRGREHWTLLLLASLLVLAFATGAWLVDWDVRRRHGGFRV
jgi:SH3 domain protein